MVLDLLQKRASCRSFSRRVVSPEIIRYILECGRLSPSGGNEQPWKFGLVTHRELIRRIARAAGVNYSQEWVGEAAFLVALCTRILPLGEEDVGMNRFPSMGKILRDMDPGLYQLVYMEAHQVNIPGTHMILAAMEHGVYSTWIASVDCEEVGRMLGVEDCRVTHLIAFGYPAETPPPTPKKPLEEISFTNAYSQPGVHLPE